MSYWQADLVSKQLELGECQRLPRAINSYAPCFEQNHALGVGGAQIEIMADEHDAPATGARVIDGADELLNTGLIETCTWFIEGQDITLKGYYSCRCHEAALCRGDVVWMHVGDVGQSTDGECMCNTALNLIGTESKGAWPKGNLVADGCGKELIAHILKDNPNVCCVLTGCASGNIMCMNPDRTCSRAQEPIQMAQERAFAGAIAPKQGNVLTSTDVHADAVEDRCIGRIGKMHVVNL
jgi:hypothetical protein